jgi:hypothetical protein
MGLLEAAVNRRHEQPSMPQGPASQEAHKGRRQEMAMGKALGTVG